LKSLRPLSTKGKAEIAIKDQDKRAVSDSTGFCGFVDGYFDNQDIIEAINSTAGINVDEQFLRSLGGKIIQLERKINSKRGLTKKDDTLSERLLNYPMKIYLKTSLIGEKNLEEMKKEYYKLRGW